MGSVRGLTPLERGRRIAQLLAGSWRDTPAAPLEGDDLDSIVPCLVASASAGLGWWRLRALAEERSALVALLRRSFETQGLGVAPHERRLGAAIERLRSAGIEPFTAKGWAAGRMYPSPALRPCGDIDLYVRPDAYAAAVAALGAWRAGVDLHRGCPELDDRDWPDLERHARTLTLGTTQARVFGPEDHLRLLALHMLRHGAWRPLWLCDVAVACEAARGRLDWKRLLSGLPRRTVWLVCALRLARDLLEADLQGAPPEVLQARLPRWLVGAVLRQWGSLSFVPHGARRPMAACLRRPTTLPRALWIRWPNPVEASFDLGAPLDETPRWPYQLAACVVRTGRFVRRLAAPGAA